MRAIISVQVESVRPFDRCFNRLFWLSYRDNFISSNWRPLLAFFISVRNNTGIQSFVSCSLHHYGISCLLRRQLCWL